MRLFCEACIMRGIISPYLQPQALGFLAAGGQVESRTTSSGSTTTCRDGGCSGGDAIWLTIASAASRPIVRRGWRTVVNAGFWNAAD